MSDQILKLTPETVWKNFYSLTQIPRPSGKEGAVINFAKKFGENLGLHTVVDSVGNVIIRKPATPGMEKRKGIVLQGHLDMVPQKNSDKIHDFEKDPIDPVIVNDWVKANGTTLGADNGIGVAAILSVLESKTLVHGQVEALLTIDEETGMTGAFGLQPGMFTGEILLNLDSEDEGELYIGCAGGVNANMKLAYHIDAVSGDVKAYKLSITGLKGGHSGLDINMGRGNSNKLMFRFLKKATTEFKLRLATIEGGSLRNAIPREAFAVVVVPAGFSAQFTKAVAEYQEIYRKELSVTEPDLSFVAVECSKPASVIDMKAQINLINSVYACPNGMVRLSDSIPGLVETSNNLAIVKSHPEYIEITCLLRSSVDSAKDDLSMAVSSVFELAGAEVELSGGYPGWKPNPDSEILTLMKDIYNKKYNKIPDVKAIHAGLECGLLGGVYPNWDMISFGPTIRHPHSPDEKVLISSVQKFWDFLVEVLKNAPVA
ncbi:MAG: aminoacyl-histidine dipeptidase [Bacteroidia bacterium]|nr:aminoacyl-histidine dipeptidase [Bacteroidia bacterium]